MDFVRAVYQQSPRGPGRIVPQFVVKKCKDIMIKGHELYAVWDERAQRWSGDQDTVSELVDEELERYKESLSPEEKVGVRIARMTDSSSGSMDAFHHYVHHQCADNYHQLDATLVFSDVKPSRELYSTKSLPYAMGEGPAPAYDELMETLYSPEERMKIEWSIGAIISGDSKKLQKFIVFYGSMGTGKSTVLNIIEMLFDGYCTTFDAEALGSRTDAYALAPFKDNPLVAIQHDGDLSRIETNVRLNSIISHENMVVNEKYKSQYIIKPSSFLYMGTNKPVKITDAKSGLLRRLIDVRPTGNILPKEQYECCMDKIPFELGAIANHCLQVYLKNKRLYDSYVPLGMMGNTNDFYNFVEENYDIFQEQQIVTLKAAWAMYKEYVDYAKVAYPMSMRAFAAELSNYFYEYKDRCAVKEGEETRYLRRAYVGFREDKFVASSQQITATSQAQPKKSGDETREDNEEDPFRANIADWLRMKSVAECGGQVYFDKYYAECIAQPARDNGKPNNSWDRVKSRLKDLDTSMVHYVLMPDPRHICIDFDIKGADGAKNLELNLEAASKFPPTYAEVSKSGAGVHLHYIYTGGDPDRLSRVFGDGVEIKVFTGKQSLRRVALMSNGIEQISEIGSGLPLKEEKSMVNWTTVANEKAIRTIVRNNLQKKYMPGTKPSVDLIFKTLEDAHNSGLIYDVTDLRPAVLAFAAGSTNHASYCITLVNKMKWCSDVDDQNFPREQISAAYSAEAEDKKPIAFVDVEVFPNLFVVCWKPLDGDCISLINPKPYMIEDLCNNYRLVGFNNRKYDNHMLYGAMLGYSNEQLYKLSQRLINGSPNVSFLEAYSLAWADVYDYSSKKQSLKKFEIELGIHHQELGLPWDQPVDESLWGKVAEYCCNDVVATEAVFKQRKADLIAREILADLSGLTVAHTTQQHVTRIIFGSERHPKLVYTDLSTIFPGYEFCSTGIDPERYIKDENGKPVFTSGKSIFMGEDPSEGGYVYAKPGMYWNVVTFDVASLHPSSILALNKFGEHTYIYREIRDARIAIKRGELDKARGMLGGKLAKYLTDEAEAKKLAGALKLVLNSTYGYCSASFECPFKDPRDVDNIVAKRGALFMIALKNEVIKRGYTVIHCKTDSIKVVEPDDEITNFIYEFGRKYGYEFEIEAKYEKICLVNRAVYVAKEEGGRWTATGAQFQVPYVFKTLFSHEPIIFEDKCVTKSVTSNMYLDMNEGLLEDEHDLHFVGRCGQYCPIKQGSGGGVLVRADSKQAGKYDAVTGTKGYRWLESEVVKATSKEAEIDISYFVAMVDEAVKAIQAFGDFDEFVA